MNFEGAVIKEQGVTFAIAIVRNTVLQSPNERQKAQAAFTQVFEGLPVVLMAQDGRGRPSYWGRTDLSRFLANVPLNAIPWRRYTYDN
jgi:hypothetical protein